MRGSPTAVLVLIVAALTGMGSYTPALAKEHNPGPPSKSDGNSSAKNGGGHHEAGASVKLVGWLEISGPLRAKVTGTESGLGVDNAAITDPRSEPTNCVVPSITICGV